MRFTPLILAAIAGLSVATPVTSANALAPEIEKRGLFVVICEAACAALCGVGQPLACLACAAACLETAVDDGGVLEPEDLEELAALTAAVA